MPLNTSFNHMWLKDVDVTVAVREIERYEERWVSEDELFELFYCLRVERTEDKKNVQSILHHFKVNRLVEREFRGAATWDIYKGEKFKITKEGMEILKHLYTIVYLGTS